METEKVRCNGRPNSVAVVDKDTRRFIRWEKDPERQNPIGGTMRARNPSEIALSDSNPGDSHSTTTDPMERQNQVGDYVGTSLGLIQTGSVIFAGQLIADYAFGWIDGQLENQNQWLRRAVRVLGPATAGGVLYTSTKNEYVRGIALGHAMSSARQLIEMALGFVFPQNGNGNGNGNGQNGNGSNVDTGGSEENGGTQGLAQRRKMLASGYGGGYGMGRYGSMSGGFSADQPRSEIRTGSGMGQMNQRQTVMAGA